MPGAVADLRRLGVDPAGPPVRRASATSTATARVEARFRPGPGLGVRRTALHAALSRRRRDAGVEVGSRPVDGVVEDARRPRAASTASGRASWSPPTACTPRSAGCLGLDRPHGRHRRATGCAGTIAVAPWTPYVEVHWAPRGRGLRDPGRPTTWSASPSSPRAGGRLRRAARRLPAAGASGWPGAGVAAVRGAGPLRQRVAPRWPGACCWSATRPATSTRSPARGWRVGWAAARPPRAVWRRSPAGLRGGLAGRGSAVVVVDRGAARRDPSTVAAHPAWCRRPTRCPLSTPGWSTSWPDPVWYAERRPGHPLCLPVRCGQRGQRPSALKC